VKYKISFIKPNFPSSDEIVADYSEIVSSNWFTNFGPKEQSFSKKSAQFISSDVYATTIANCTLGIESAIAELLKGDRKKVLLPSFTFAAGAEAILRSGFEPLFIDVDRKSWQPNIEQAEQILTESDDIAGILLCNVFGVGNTNITEWEKLASKFAKPLIIDSAAGFGSKYFDEEKVGTRGDCEIFSMHATKPFAIGEGGLVVSKNEKLIRRIREWQNFGFGTNRQVQQIGTNAKLQEINAAIGLRQLDKFDERLKGRRATLKLYKQLLKTDKYSFQQNDENSTVPFASVVLASQDHAAAARKALAEAGVEARQYYEPLHLQALLSRYVDPAVNLEATEFIASRIISLPVHDNMDEKDVQYIAKVIRDHEV